LRVKSSELRTHRWRVREFSTEPLAKAPWLLS
jgi:hypothetical protein